MGYRIGDSENDVRDTILDYLRKRQIFAWRDKQSQSHIARKAFPESIGVSDILGILKGGRMLAVEVKKPKGKITIEQQRFLEAIHTNGGLAFIATCLDDVKERLP